MDGVSTEIPPFFVGGFFSDSTIASRPISIFFLKNILLHYGETFFRNICVTQKLPIYLSNFKVTHYDSKH